jgi:RimJ/RimL family protein N-acetyltransferase
MTSSGEVWERNLVKRLLAAAWRAGVRRLFGEIKSDNRAMLALAAQLGFRTRGSLQDPSVIIASNALGAPVELPRRMTAKGVPT